MKTRLLHTDFWLDDQVSELPATTKLLYMYLFTNPHIGTTPIYKISNKVLCFETGLSITQIEQGKTKLIEIGKIRCYKDYVYILNADRYNKYHLGQTTSVAYKKEMADIPEDVKKALLTIQPDTLSGKEDTLRNHKQEIIINKEERDTKREKQKASLDYLRNLTDEAIVKFSDYYNCSQDQVKSKAEDIINYCKAKGKKYDDYHHALHVWLKKDYGLRIKKVQFIPDEVAPQISEDQRMRNLQRIAEMKKTMLRN